MLATERENEIRAKNEVAQLNRNLETNIYINFGRVIAQKRKEKQWTQEQLAERIGLGRTSITNIEKGKQKILLDDLFKFAFVFGVKPSELLSAI